MGIEPTLTGRPDQLENAQRSSIKVPTQANYHFKDTPAV